MTGRFAVAGVLIPAVCGVCLQGCEKKAAPLTPPATGRKVGKCSAWESHPRSMDCGPGVPLCGVLTLETGTGSGVYHHDEPVVHGLWPQVPGYGNSKCIAPKNAQAPTKVYPCYDQKGEAASKNLWFERHEWQSHGECAGVSNAEDFFNQVCGLAQGAIHVLAAAKAARLDLVHTADQLQRSGFCVWDTGSNAQVELSACAGPDGQWKLADVQDFPALCGAATGKPVPAPALPPAPVSPKPSPVTPVCVPNRRGPPCRADSDCENLAGCLRCARSGFCTDLPLSVSLAGTRAARLHEQGGHIDVAGGMSGQAARTRAALIIALITVGLVVFVAAAVLRGAPGSAKRWARSAKALAAPWLPPLAARDGHSEPAAL